MIDAIWNTFWMLFPFAVKIVAALGIGYWATVKINDMLGVTFSRELEIMRQDPRALAEYYGRRWIGVALVILGVTIGSL